MDPRVGAWEPPGAKQPTSLSSGEQSTGTRLSTDAQVWQPPSAQTQHSADSGGQPVRRSADFYPSDATSSGHVHGNWAPPEPATYYPEGSTSVEDSATGAAMRGGLLVVDSSSGGTGDGNELLYGGFQHTDQYSTQGEDYNARPEQSSYGADTYQSHGFPPAHTTHEQHTRHLYGDEAVYDYDYGAVAFVHPQSFEHAQAGVLGSLPEHSPSTGSDSLESPALIYSPGGTMYSLPGAGPPASSASSPVVLSRADLQVPELLRSRSRSAHFAPLSAPPVSSSPRLSVEIGVGLGAAELPQQPVDYIGVVDFECTCDRIRSQRQCARDLLWHTADSFACRCELRVDLCILTNLCCVPACISDQMADQSPSGCMKSSSFRLCL